MRTAIYVDGFNLYYWLKPTPYRWVDLQTLAMSAIARPDREHTVVAVKYFTARVSDTLADPGKSTRQDIYIKALQATIPNLSIHFGEFRRQPKWMPRVAPGGGAGSQVQVWDTEEKGSDVNLAVELVNDAWSNVYDLAIVVSNDSDLERALIIAKRKGRTVGALVRGDAQVRSLRRAASFVRMLSEQQVASALMPRQIPNSAIRIPAEWLEKEQRGNVR